MSMTDSQLRAVTAGTGPVMVLAGPGSGKTLVITERARYLIQEKKIRPEAILVVTFSRAAAAEMRGRFAKRMGKKTTGVTFGTFHAVFFQILKAAYHFDAGSILKEEERSDLILSLMRRVMDEEGQDKLLAAAVGAEIGLVKNQQIPLEHFYSAAVPEEAFRQSMQGYEKGLRSRGKLDFDDMLTLTERLLTEREDILAAWRAKFRYILVDEFQDISPLQYKITRLLAAPDNHLFVVGDDDQSIYRFRGASPAIMLGFPKDYPDAEICALEENFRCAGRIVQAAGEVISGSGKRYEKHIRCVKQEEGKVVYRRFPGPREEALAIVSEILRRKREGVPLREMAVLTRTNAGLRYLAGVLTESGIPMNLTGSVPDVYSHWTAADVFAYLRLAQGPFDRRDFLMIMNRPLRYMSRESAAGAESLADVAAFYREKPWMAERVEKLQEDLDRVRQMRPYAAVQYIRTVIGYERFLETYAAQHGLDARDLTDVLDEVQEGAEPFADAKAWAVHILQLRRELARKEPAAGGGDALNLATLHAAKGLEFDTVFLPDLNEGTLPHRKSLQAADLEEERRLLYVGMTRAKSRLHLYWLESRCGKALRTSRFLKALMEP